MVCAMMCKHIPCYTKKFYLVFCAGVGLDNNSNYSISLYIPNSGDMVSKQICHISIYITGSHGRFHVTSKRCVKQGSPCDRFIWFGLWSVCPGKSCHPEVSTRRRCRVSPHQVTASKRDTIYGVRTLILTFIPLFSPSKKTCNRMI